MQPVGVPDPKDVSAEGAQAVGEQAQTPPLLVIQARVDALTPSNHGSPFVSRSFDGVQPPRAQLHTEPTPLPVIVQYTRLPSTAIVFGPIPPASTVGFWLHPPSAQLSMDPSVPYPSIPAFAQ